MRRPGPPGRAALAALLTLALLLVPALAEAQSGGYRRPSAPAPSYSAPSYSAPSYGGSGGYRRPSSGSSGYSTGSGGDTSVSRGASGQALQQYRASQQPRRPVDTPAQPGWDAGGLRRPPSSYGGPSYGGPVYAGPGFGGSFGSAAFWAFLGALSASDRSAYFRQYGADPAYRAWQQQALADPDAAAKLRALGDPAAQGGAGGGHGGLVWIVLLAGAGVLVVLWLARRRADSRPAVPPAAISGSKTMRFRVGQTMPLDPTPFVLAAGTTKVQPPPPGDMISVEAVGLIEDAGAQLHRLYLPGRTAFFQLHLGRDGAADECRYFSRIDEVQPADQAEWGQWLDPNEGMIGWPAFQTKDGKTYGRVWTPGQSKVQPRAQTETLQSLDGTAQRRLAAMLYGGPTGAAPPAPPNEYILVEAVEDGPQAWVEIHAGIDVNPAALTLPPVPI
jgi:hypothetical protein